MGLVTSARMMLWDGASWATTVDFNQEEVSHAELIPLFDMETLKAHNALPIIIDAGKTTAQSSGRERWQFDIGIIHHFQTTKAKVEQLIDCDYKIRVYYNYAGDVTLYRDFVLDPNYEEIYYYGSQAARIMTELHFYGEAN